MPKIAVRKLATVAAAYAAAVFAAHYIVPEGYFWLCAAVFAAAGIAALFITGMTAKRTVLVLLAAAVGFFACFLSYSAKTVPAEAFAGQQTAVEAKVVEYPTVYDDYSVTTVRLTGDGAPHVKALLYCGGDDADGIVPGDIVSFEATVKSASERYGKPWDGYTADNVYLLCYAKSSVEVIGKSRTAFLYFPQTIAKRVVAAAKELFSEKTAPFIEALLTGNKVDLYDDAETYASFADAGILHVVAVSGMHISFLAGFFWLILRKRKAVSLIGIPGVWIFAFTAGASPSVLRAAFMFTMVLTAPLLHRENDGITSLSAALLILLLINPDACASVSLQLSFSAMLGIILITPAIYRHLTEKLRGKQGKRKQERGLHKFLNALTYAVIAAFSASLGALVFSVPVMVLQFGYVSLYSVFVNVLVFWAVSGAFLLGGISVFLGMIWLPLGTATAALTNILAVYIIDVARFASGLPYAALYTENNFFAWWIVFVYVMFIACYALRRGRKFRPILPVSAAVCVLCAAVVFTELGSMGSGAEMTALDVGQGECILLTDGDDTFIVDCGGKGTFKNAGQIAASKLLSDGRREIDVLALTHFDEDHVNGVISLMCRVQVDCLVIPDVDRQERYDIVEFAESHGTEVYIISDDTEFSAGGLTLTAYAPVSRTDPELIFLASSGDCDILITGDADEETEKRFLLKNELPDTEIYVVGHHGSKYSSCEELLEAAKAETAVISCGYNSYGHPTEETLSRLEAAGMNILRTDEDGSITIDLED